MRARLFACLSIGVVSLFPPVRSPRCAPLAWFWMRWFEVDGWTEHCRCVAEMGVIGLHLHGEWEGLDRGKQARAGVHCWWKGWEGETGVPREKSRESPACASWIRGQITPSPSLSQAGHPQDVAAARDQRGRVSRPSLASYSKSSP